MVKAKCIKCEYKWKTTSKMVTVSCPSCGNKVKIRELKAVKETVHMEGEA